MSRFVIVTWDGAGNLVSTLAIARALSEDGHDVRVLGHPSIEDRCGSEGWRFRPFVHSNDYDSTAAWAVHEEMSILAPALWFNGGPGRDLLDELDREAADVVLVDCMLFGALSAGIARGVPTVALFHSPISGFRGGPMVDLLAPNIPALNTVRADLGLGPVEAVADVHDECALSLVFTAREFDVDLPLPANVRFAGPMLDGPSLSTRHDEVPVADGPSPLVLVSFSTSYQAQLDVLQRVVDALGELPVKVVVTTGPSVSPEAITAPANTTVARFVPHQDVLPHASVVVSHAGLGTVMSALSHGVPMVCVPMGRDQFFNAAMVERLGAGRVVMMDADADALRAEVQAVLDDPQAKAAAKAMAGVIAGYGGGADAIRELEALATRP